MRIGSFGTGMLTFRGNGQQSASLTPEARNLPAEAKNTFILELSRPKPGQSKQVPSIETTIQISKAHVADFVRRLNQWAERQGLSLDIEVRGHAWINSTVEVVSSRQVMERLAASPEFNGTLQQIDVSRPINPEA